MFPCLLHLNSQCFVMDACFAMCEQCLMRQFVHLGGKEGLGIWDDCGSVPRLRQDAWLTKSRTPQLPLAFLGFGPKGGRSPVEHRGNLYGRTSVRPYVLTSVLTHVPPPRPASGRPEPASGRLEPISGEGGLSQPLGGLSQPLGGLSQPLGGLSQPLGGQSQPLGGHSQPL